jgi:hypothetical protein
MRRAGELWQHHDRLNSIGEMNWVGMAPYRMLDGADKIIERETAERNPRVNFNRPFGMTLAPCHAQSKSFQANGNSYRAVSLGEPLFSKACKWHGGCSQPQQTKWRATGRS